MFKIGKLVLFVLIALFGVSGSAMSHVYWMKSHKEQEISLEYMRMSYDNSREFHNPYNYNFSGYFHMTGKAYLAAQLPVAQEWNDALVGNPYLGVELIDREKSAMFLQLGIRMPLTTDDLLLSNVDWTSHLIAADQFESFMPFTWVLQPVVGYQWILPRGEKRRDVIRLSAGPTALLPANADNFALFDMNAEAWLTYANGFEFGAGLQGRVPINDHDMFAESFIALTSVGARFHLHHVHPGIRFTLPLTKDFSDDVNFIIGVDATVDLIKWVD